MRNGSSSTEGGPLACPRCAIHYPLEERFCAQCGMPLTYSGRSGEEPITEAHERARKIKPQYAQGEPVKAGWARNQSEAELLQGLLLEEGIPSTLRRTRGFDVPEMLAAGPRDVLVPASGAAAAREVLLEAELIDGEVPEPTSPARLLVGLLIGVAVAGIVVVVLDLLG